jgi:hypothetical protein
LANDQAQIVRFLEALNEGDPAEILRRFLEHKALEWIDEGLRYGDRLGFGAETSTPILLKTVNQICALVADHLERERADARPGWDA